MASRKHLENINQVFSIALKEANLTIKSIECIAVVNQPGLMGSLSIGVANAKLLSLIFKKPIIFLNHIYSHLYAPHLEHDLINFPNLGLVASGGHTLLFYSYNHRKHICIGKTINDAVGESFDKVSKFFKLGYPGGPIIDNLAKKGNENQYLFPKAYLKSKKKEKFYQWSYSGLKTAVMYQSEQFKTSEISANKDKNLLDILASFQKIAIDSLIDILHKASEKYNIHDIVITGGVASNSYFRNQLKEDKKIKSYFASPVLSTDNAAMVAGLGYHYYINKKHNKHYDNAKEKVNIYSKFFNSST